MPRKRTTKTNKAEQARKLKLYQLEEFREFTNEQVQKFVEETGCSNSEARDLLIKDLQEPDADKLIVLTKELKMLFVELHR